MIGANDYSFLSTLLRGTSGLTLGIGKEYLLESRLPAVAKAYGFASIEDMIQKLRAQPPQDLIKAVCDAMTTGETLFFRDQVPFELLRSTVFPALIAQCKARGTPMRIWSAASSTGQEPYSLAMLIAEMEDQFRGVPTDIFATDFADAQLTRARRGVYNDLEVQRGLPVPLLHKYFTRHPDGYHIADDIKRPVRFREFNLLDSFVSLGRFDLILCRNVLIYFDAPTKKDVLERMADALLPGGYLFLGGTETSFGVTERLQRVPGVATSLHMRREDVPPPVRTPPLAIR